MEELTSSQNIIVGLICGSIEVCVGQPLLYWKNASQQHLSFTLKPKYLYRGLIASMTNSSILTGIQFFGTGLIKRAMIGNDSKRELKKYEILLSAFIGGAMSGIACGPLSVTVIQQQRFGGNIIQTPIRIISNYGLYGIMRGVLPSVIRESIYTVGYLGMTPLLENIVVNNHRLKSYGVPIPILQFSCSMITGFVAIGLSHPADTVKTCMQGDIQQKLYGGASSTLNYIVHRHGIDGLYKGFMWRYSRTVIAYFIFNRTLYPVANALYPNSFNCE